MNYVKAVYGLKSPRLSEKSTRGAVDRWYVFDITVSWGKEEIKSAVQLLFDVLVEKVNVVNLKGKEKRFGRFLGRRPNEKKAYVKLKPGFSIELSSS